LSGIVGIINFDGAPVEPQHLQEMTDSLAFRGPDRQEIWIDGSAGFGHTMLAVSPEHEREKQPCSLDGKIWIVADARIDDRPRLKRELGLQGRIGLDDATDVELILHAYHVWNEDCVQHLLGDFSFAIWDSSQKRLFCARDHFGIRLFYYALIGNCFIFSNTISAIRLHPLVSNKLNDLAIADYLIFSFNQELSTTTFADIQRFPPGHSLSITKDSVQKRQYYILTIDMQIRYKRDEEYVEHFLELLDLAVGDRVRNPKIAIWMSGGLDSPTLAASAKRTLAKQYSEYDLRAYTVYYDSLIPDNERYYAGLAAEKIGIPIYFISNDEQKLRLESSDYSPSEPFHWSVYGRSEETFRQMTGQNRIVLYGEDPDALLYPASMMEMLKMQGVFTTGYDIFKYLIQHRRRPPLGLGLISTINAWLGKKVGGTFDNYPVWLNPEFEAQYELRERWQELSKPRVHANRNFRQGAYHRLSNPYWQFVLENIDAGNTGLAVQLCLPYQDLRLAIFLLSLPTLPWAFRKYLLRKSGAGILPDELLLRSKTTLQADPLAALLGEREIIQIDKFIPVSKLDSYVIQGAIPSIEENLENIMAPWINIRPYCLNFWLQSFA
jgi:asparagine synthase (glutamine-hydrolysing)